MTISLSAVYGGTHFHCPQCHEFAHVNWDHCHHCHANLQNHPAHVAIDNSIHLWPLPMPMPLPIPQFDNDDWGHGASDDDEASDDDNNSIPALITLEQAGQLNFGSIFGSNSASSHNNFQSNVDYNVNNLSNLLTNISFPMFPTLPPNSDSEDEPYDPQQPQLPYEDISDYSDSDDDDINLNPNGPNGQPGHPVQYQFN